MAKGRTSGDKSSRGGKTSATSSQKRGRKTEQKPATSSSKKSKSSTKPVFHFTSSRISLWQLNTKSEALAWSENSPLFFALRKQDTLPSHLEELYQWIHRDDRSSFKAKLRGAIRTKSEFSVECKVVTPDGNFRWMEFSAAPLTPTRSGGLRFEGFVHDTTLKKLTEFELHDWKARNELISTSAGLLIYDYDIATGEILWSGNVVQLVGYTSLEMGSIEHWAQLIHPDDRAEANTLLDKARLELRPYDVYYRFRTKSKGYCHMHDRGMFVADHNGEAVRMLGVMNDVSDRFEAYQTVQQSEKSYRELFNSVGEAIFIQKPDGTFVDVNKGACDMYGYSKEELVGKNPRFLAAPEKNDFENMRYLLEEAMNGRPASFKWWGRKKSGEMLIKEINLTKGTYFGDEIIIATAWDITDKIAAEQSLQESEKRFRRLIEDLNVGVIVLGRKNEIQISNKAALRLLASAEQDITGRSLLDEEWGFLAEDGKQWSAPEYPWSAAAAQKKAVRGVVMGITHNARDTTVWVLVNAEPTLVDDGKLFNIVITLTDITVLKEIEEDLKESELRFRTLQEASFGGIGLHSKGKIWDCNQGLCDITGYSYEELIGSDGLNLIAPEYRDFVYQQIVNKTELPYDVQGIRKDGSRYYLEIQGKNIPYEEGLIRVTEFRDITDRKASEAKILEQNARLLTITEDLKVRNEQLQEFTQIVSHNLRSPVGNILSLLNFIENAESAEERNEYISLLKEAGVSTLTTLQELNEVLQIKQNKNIERQSLRFEDVFNNVRSMLVAKIVEADADIQIDFSEAPQIQYPVIYLESIFLNLLSNALKYVFPGRKPVIKIRSYKSGKATFLSVADNGLGLNMDRYGHHIFKLRKTFHKHPESRGIGLFMIKNQIEAMGGDISVSSVENEGTTFLINFDSRNQDDEL